MEPNLVVPLTIKFGKRKLNSNENSLEAKSTVAVLFLFLELLQLRRQR
jgi:hypothetical protein